MVAVHPSWVQHKASHRENDLAPARLWKLKAQEKNHEGSNGEPMAAPDPDIGIQKGARVSHLSDNESASSSRTNGDLYLGVGKPGLLLAAAGATNSTASMPQRDPFSGTWVGRLEGLGRATIGRKGGNPISWI